MTTDLVEELLQVRARYHDCLLEMKELSRRTEVLLHQIKESAEKG